jgi:hypothetical protein
VSGGTCGVRRYRCILFKHRPAPACFVFSQLARGATLSARAGLVDGAHDGRGDGARGRHAEGARSGLDGGRAATAGHGRVSLLALSLLSLSHPLSSCPTREWWRAAAPQRAWRKPSTATTGAASGHDAASLQAGCDTGGFLPDRPHPLLSFPPIPPPPPPSSSTSRTGAQRQQQTSAGVARGPTRQLGAGTGHAAGRVL